MLVAVTVARIRREYFVNKKSIKEIVRKVIRSGATAFGNERAAQPRPKIDP